MMTTMRKEMKARRLVNICLLDPFLTLTDDRKGTYGEEE